MERQMSPAEQYAAMDDTMCMSVVSAEEKAAAPVFYGARTPHDEYREVQGMVRSLSALADQERSNRHEAAKSQFILMALKKHQTDAERMTVANGIASNFTDAQMVDFVRASLKGEPLTASNIAREVLYAAAESFADLEG
jgi:hypothetical protein